MSVRIAIQDRSVIEDQSSHLNEISAAVTVGLDVIREAANLCQRIQLEGGDRHIAVNKLQQALGILRDKPDNLIEAALVTTRANDNSTIENLEGVEKTSHDSVSDAEVISPAPVSVHERIAALISKYSVEVLGDCRVSLILPEGTSREEFLREVQALAQKEYGKSAVWPAQVTTYGSEAAFMTPAPKACFISVLGNVRDSTYKTYSGQVAFLAAEGLAMPKLKDLVVAHAAYFLATGRDLFAGNSVRAGRAALIQNVDGWGVSFANISIDNSGPRIAAAANLSKRN